MMLFERGDVSDWPSHIHASTLKLNRSWNLIAWFSGRDFYLKFMSIFVFGFKGLLKVVDAVMIITLNMKNKNQIEMKIETCTIEHSQTGSNQTWPRIDLFASWTLYIEKCSPRHIESTEQRTIKQTNEHSGAEQLVNLFCLKKFCDVQPEASDDRKREIMNIEGIESDVKQRTMMACTEERKKEFEKNEKNCLQHQQQQQTVFVHFISWYFIKKNEISYIYCIYLINIKPNKSEIKKKIELMRSTVSRTNMYISYTHMSTTYTNAQYIYSSFFFFGD